jgi:ribonuclease Z
MKLITIGCASGMPSPGFSHSCYLIEQADRLYMLDCGDGASSALRRCRINTSAIEHIFISHTHPDHVSGIPMFVQMQYLEDRREPLTIFIPSEFERAFYVMMRSLYLFPEKVGFDLTVGIIDERFEFDNGSVKIRAYANSHLTGYREFFNSRECDNRMQCFSFVVEGGGKKLAYSADVGGLDDLSDIAIDADLLLTEGMHLDLAQLPALLIEKNVKRCILTHLPDDFNRQAARSAFLKSGCNVRFAGEGQSVDI